MMAAEVVEAGVAEGDPVAEGGEHLGGGGRASRVLVDPQEPEIGSGLEQEPGVPATSQRGIHQDPGWDRPEQLDDRGRPSPGWWWKALVMLSSLRSRLPVGSLICSPPAGGCRRDVSPTGETEAGGVGAVHLADRETADERTHCLCPGSFASSSLLLCVCWCGAGGPGARSSVRLAAQADGASSAEATRRCCGHRCRRSARRSRSRPGRRPDTTTRLPSSRPANSRSLRSISDPALGVDGTSKVVGRLVRTQVAVDLASAAPCPSGPGPSVVILRGVGTRCNRSDRWQVAAGTRTSGGSSTAVPTDPWGRAGARTCPTNAVMPRLCRPACLGRIAADRRCLTASPAIPTGPHRKPHFPHCQPLLPTSRPTSPHRPPRPPPPGERPATRGTSAPTPQAASRRRRPRPSGPARGCTPGGIAVARAGAGCGPGQDEGELGEQGGAARRRGARRSRRPTRASSSAAGRGRPSSATSAAGSQRW